MTSRIEVSIRKSLPGFTLDVEWSADDGVVALFGPSGAGKTLTLQCLAGLVRPDAGRIVVDGHVLFDAAGRHRRAAPAAACRLRLPGLRAVPAPHRARQRGLRPSRPGPGRAPAPEDEVLARLALEAFAERYPRELSGGQRQRVALGRALATDPALLLLDEPLSALDLPLRQALRDELRSILTGWGIAAVLVTHDLTEAYRLGDRIVVYEEGRVIQAAPRAELLWQPSSRAVARIMGIRNLVQGVTLKATPDRIQFRWRGQVLEAVNSPTRAYLPAPDSPLAFFIRPGVRAPDPQGSRSGRRRAIT